MDKEELYGGFEGMKLVDGEWVPSDGLDEKDWSELKNLTDKKEEPKPMTWNEKVRKLLLAVAEII